MAEYRECKWSPQDQDACPFCSGEFCGRCGSNPNPPCQCDSLARHEHLSMEDIFSAATKKDGRHE